MIVAVHQPQFLPWLGYFDKMDKADAFCYLDDVQFKKNEWQNRNRIKTASGWQWITVPVRYRFPRVIYKIEIENSRNWAKKHLHAIRTSYGRAPYFKAYFGMFEEAYAKPWTYLSDLNIFLTETIRRILRIDEKPAMRASSLYLDQDPTGRLVDICRALGADTYLSGRQGPKYMDLSRFEQCGIRVLVQDFKHPEYPQLFGGFESHLSVVDMLFNCGPDSIDRIRGG